MKNPGCHFILIIITLSLVACNDYPRDTHHSFNTAQKESVIKLGVIDHPPWATQHNKQPSGFEVNVIDMFATSINTKPQWFFISESEAIKKLEAGEIDIALGGFTQDSPWGKRVAFSRPYLITGDDKDSHHVFAIRKGENKLMVTLESYLKEHQALILKSFQELSK